MRGRGRAASGNRTPGPRGSYLGGYSAGRGIYSRYHEGKAKLDKPYELMPSLELAASVNSIGMKPGTSQWDRYIHPCPSQTPLLNLPARNFLSLSPVWFEEHLVNHLIMVVAGWSGAKGLPFFLPLRTTTLNICPFQHDQKVTAVICSSFCPFFLSNFSYLVFRPKAALC